MYLDTIPSGTADIILFRTAANVTLFSLRILTNGRLQVVPSSSGGTSGTTVLSVNTPYLVQVSYTITSTTVFTIKVFLNQKLEITSTTGTLGTTVSDRFQFQLASATGVNANMWVRDFFIDNLSTLDSPGDIIVTNKRPNANGAANNYTTQIGSGGSGYGTGHSPQVNEQPLSTTNGWSIASASSVTEEYSIENSATGDKNVSNPRYTLVDYMGWIYAKTGTADTRNIIVNGVSSNISVTTSYAMYTKAAGSTSYPSGNTAIGMNNNSLVALDSLAECGILLAYKLPRRISVTP
jgi:hypothetical protein